jgi:hypothetical protein
MTIRQKLFGKSGFVDSAKVAESTLQFGNAYENTSDSATRQKNCQTKNQSYYLLILWLSKLVHHAIHLMLEKE